MDTLEAPLIEGFRLINEFFHKHEIRYCLIGGISAGFWGEPRYTQDMDFTVFSRSRSLEKIIELLKKEKFTVSEKGPSQLQVRKKGSIKFQADLILAELDYQDWVIQRAKIVSIFDIETHICSPEDLIILKLIANRRRDLLDIERVLQNEAVKLDHDYLQEWMEHWELKDLFEKEFGKLDNYG